MGDTLIEGRKTLQFRSWQLLQVFWRVKSPNQKKDVRKGSFRLFPAEKPFLLASACWWGRLVDLAMGKFIWMFFLVQKFDFHWDSLNFQLPPRPKCKQRNRHKAPISGNQRALVFVGWMMMWSPGHFLSLISPNKKKWNELDLCLFSKLVASWTSMFSSPHLLKFFIHGGFPRRSVQGGHHPGLYPQCGRNGAGRFDGCQRHLGLEGSQMGGFGGIKKSRSEQRKLVFFRIFKKHWRVDLRPIRRP